MGIGVSLIVNLLLYLIYITQYQKEALIKEQMSQGDWGSVYLSWIGIGVACVIPAAIIVLVFPAAGASGH